MSRLASRPQIQINRRSPTTHQPPQLHFLPVLPSFSPTKPTILGHILSTKKLITHPMFCASHINQGHGVHTVPFRAIPTQALAIHKDMTQVPSATATQDLTATRDPAAWASTGSTPRIFFGNPWKNGKPSTDRKSKVWVGKRVTTGFDTKFGGSSMFLKQFPVVFVDPLGKTSFETTTKPPPNRP
jgi:hypothetical protein